MKFSWGTGVTLTMMAFIALMAGFMIKAIQEQEELVAEDYYAQELRYQDRMDKIHRAGVDRVTFQVEGDSLLIAFQGDPPARATLRLQRPSDERADRAFEVLCRADGRCAVPVTDLLRGMYKAELEWTGPAGVGLVEERIVVP
ncbi:MAG: FixH family protein [Flavobacteriales bacterium]|jgi:hypothetical protein|nr:FixH family protein [Flavobacteriales bacterium]MBK7942426.1 FixH family protein [Flavobacteriales bacterium]MBK8948242.1 FixH family protein [Flavobacteriales bacterium]MBK9699173.1 FixH family protein [Flavobacteriales bacterium]